jgi:hypothetical protein
MIPLTQSAASFMSELSHYISRLAIVQVGHHGRIAGQLLISSLLKKASEAAIASAVRNSSSSKANKKRDSVSHPCSK